MPEIYVFPQPARRGGAAYALSDKAEVNRPGFPGDSFS
jgi:hypothetical protein